MKHVVCIVQMKNTYRTFLRISERNILLGKWEVNIKVRLKEMRYLDVAVGETSCEPSCSIKDI
jgi:hypothetical protein